MTDLAPLDFANVREWLRKTVAAVNAALNGVNRTVGEVTLTANAATTTVTSPYVTEESHITLMAQTSNAAQELKSAGGIYVSARTNGTSFVLTHANNAQSDRTFSYAIENP